MTDSTKWGDDVSAHHCHALGCKRPCPPAHLMCGMHWARVPADIQREVYDTCRQRGDNCDETWAPWWRAAHRAIHHVAMLDEPNEEKGRNWLERQLAFADTLEARAARRAASTQPDGDDRG